MHDVHLVRLSAEIGSNEFSIHDSVTGGVVIFKEGAFVAFTLDRDLIIQHMQLLQSALMSYNPIKCIKQPSDVLSNDSSVVIVREDGQDSWTLCSDKYSAKLANNKLRYHRKLDINLILSRVNKMLCMLYEANQILQPRVDIVRRIPDAHLVVWAYGEHSTVCYEDGIKGITMTNCLVDGKYYDMILVQSEKALGTCTLFNTNLEPIVQYPLDDSIEFFYADDENQGGM